MCLLIGDNDSNFMVSCWRSLTISELEEEAVAGALVVVAEAVGVVTFTCIFNALHSTPGYNCKNEFLGSLKGRNRIFLI